MAESESGTVRLPDPERHLARAYHLALRVAGDPALAEDAVQDAYARILASPPEDLGRELPAAYFLRAAYLSAITLRRGERLRRAREERYAMEERAGAPRPEQAAAERELAGAARAAMADLPPEMRAAVALCCEQGLTQRQAAEVMGLPPGTVARQVQRGLERLRRRLAAAGYSAASAGLAGLLGRAGLPAVPGRLAASVRDMAAGRLRAPGRAATTAGKGGLAMKIVAGMVAAGVLVGAAALAPGLLRRGAGAPLASPPTAKGPLQLEHYWGVGPNGYLDGPRTEAMNQGYTVGTCDDDGNLYAWSLGGGYSHCGLRALQGVMAAGRVIHISGNDYFQYDLGLAEGPASCLPPVSQAVAVGQPAEGKGCFYVHAGGRLVKLWKNPDKNGRWWFKTVFSGSKPPPTTRGAKAPAADLGMNPGNMQVDREGALYFSLGGNHYAYDDQSRTVTCILTRDELPKDKNGQPMADWGFGGVIRDDNGCFYVSEYNNLKESWRIPAGGGKAEPYVRARYGNDSRDGPALFTGWFCGPHFNAAVNPMRFLPPDCLLITCHDESWLRRVRGGRVSTLCADGEWRELEKNARGQAPGWFRNYVPGPNAVFGWVDAFRPHARVWRVPNVDLSKPTVGPALGEERGGK